LGHLLRMGNQREAAGVDLGRCGVHAFWNSGARTSGATEMGNVRGPFMA
jgi:hypothetical protein